MILNYKYKNNLSNNIKNIKMRNETTEQRQRRIEKQREYNTKNRERIKELIAQNQKSENWKERIKTSYMVCECGSEIQTVHKLVHYRTLKHKSFIAEKKPSFHQ